MTKPALLARRLVLTWGFALGCGDRIRPTPPSAGASPGETAPAGPAAVYAALTADMARLRALQIVDVDTLVVNGVEASGCYSLHPCSTDAAKPAVAAEYARQAPRLDRLATIAEVAAVAGIPGSTAIDTTADLAALNALAVVKVTALITAAPKNNPACYNLPCPDDAAAAAAENQRRAAVVHRLAVDATADEAL